MTNDEANDFASVISFGEYFKSMRETLYSKLNEERNLRSLAEWLYIFSVTLDGVEI